MGNEQGIAALQKRAVQARGDKRQSLLIRTASLAAFLSAVCLSAGNTAIAQSSDLLTRKHLTGDWGGKRSELEAAGITPSLHYLGEFAANPIGGESEGAAYAGNLTASSKFDFEKLFGAQGLSLFASVGWLHGTSLSETSIGNIFEVQGVFSAPTVRLGRLYVEQSFAQGMITLSAGRRTPGADFADVPIFGNYVNGGLINYVTYLPAYVYPPYATWGAKADLTLPNGFEFSVGAYDADTEVLDPDNGGVDFSFRPAEGVLSFAQASYSWNGQPNAPGLPGSIWFGGFGDSSKYDHLTDPDKSSYGNYGFYGIVQQQLTQEGEDRTQGLTAWGALSFSPDQTINIAPLNIFGGLTYQGLFPGRDEDVTALGLYFASFSEDLDDQDFELTIELNHHFQVAQWLQLTPQLQYIINPDGRTDIDDAGVIGLAFSVDF
ncbi:carbohydrate porin [Roseibium sp. RKSG952]|uniref:carbohydrate porin n=1 Tax=Roseibium sp. RKSG952 TaxID=2529384 RepID=UPI0012BC6ECB|nr:carbohydrate porin [Roseibium sp. RKSG952]MTH97913.1 carbohydrate porin [Roseibium sp. RKSG952]